MEQEQGIVININKGKATIQMEAGSQCLTCGAKDACCGLSGSTKRQIEIPLNKNLDNVEVGDKVSLTFQAKSRIISAFLVFVLPILMLICGYFVGFKIFKTEGVAILFGLGGLFFSFIFLWLVNKTLINNKDFIPILSKMKHENEQ